MVSHYEKIAGGPLFLRFLQKRWGWAGGAGF